MIRLVAIALLAVPFAAVAAPVPPESAAEKAARLEAETVAKRWGKVESPPGKYTARPDGNSLTLGTLGWPLQFRHGVPAFRVDREVSGDFDVRVTVRQLDPPDPSVRYENGLWAETAAGLYIIGGDHSISLFRWKAYMRGGQVPDANMQSGVWVLYAAGRLGGAAGQGGGGIDPGAAVELRVVRQKDIVSAFTRAAGQEWKQQPVRADLKLAEVVTVSLFLGHSTSMPCEATFADFTIEKPAKPGWFR